MPDSVEIGPDVQAFLRDKITSYEQLETLRHLLSRRGETFSSEDVAAALRISDMAATEALDHLCREGLLEARNDGQHLKFTYCPQDVALRDLTDRLAKAYDLNPLGIIKLMSTNSIERLRSKAIHTFAGAFLLGQRNKNDG